MADIILAAAAAVFFTAGYFAVRGWDRVLDRIRLKRRRDSLL